ncbi:interleukin-15 receptor subunit alpha isoform X2 [Alexandromys fortis]|uniref:interleukin-15 receptor subunit alpha isoform X2 n=1 Tax=Alexandromys fortis TaxID=100897 RepID=UPI0021530C3D|nr:interleukin-15 receptor subunit alpha isoform X2 [Microtus fortis]
MTSRQLSGCGVHALQVLLLLLLLLLPLRVTPGTTCPTPISVEHADIRVKNYSVNSRERYVCNSGFKRKAGTSTLTECVINKNTNTAHWTTPNLKCIRDPSLAHQSPVLPSTVVTPKVTPQPESPSPPEKEPEAVSPKSDTTLTTQTAIVPGSGLTPSQPASAGTTGTGSHESSRAPSLATTTTLEPTASPSLGIPEISPNTSKVTKGFLHVTALAVLELTEIHQPLPPKCRDERCVPTLPGSIFYS